MARRGENIYKRKDGRWEGRFIKGRYDGKIKYGYVYAKTYREVKSKLAGVLENTAVPQVQNQHAVKKLEEGFDTVAYEWLDSLKPQLKESSMIKYVNILDGYLLPEFTGRSTSDITRDEVIRYKNKLLFSGGAAGQGLSPGTVTGILSVLKNILEYASWMKDYPVADIRGISVRQLQKPMRILSLSEQRILSQYLCDDLTLCNLGILLCIYTGLRIGEICALKWEDISFEEQYLYVHQTMQRLQKRYKNETKTEILISTPKSGCSVRKIPLPDDIFRLLIKFRHPPEAYFLTGKSDKYVEPRTMQNRFKSVIKKCNIKDANFHALRHTFATRCMELGFDIKSLSEVLGHASVNITLNRYVHPSMELKQRNMNMLSELLAVR